MKARISMLTVLLAAGAAVAQDNPAAQPPAQTPAQPDMKQPDMKTASSAKTLPAEMKTMTFHGVLVDMSCGGAQTNTADRSANPPAANAPGQNCAVSTSSSQLGMKLDDGRVLRFDLV